MTRIAVAPCSPFSVTAELMRDCAELARGPGVRLHTHLAETPTRTSSAWRPTGGRPAEYAEDLGWLGPDVWLAHCVHLSDEAMRRFARDRHRRGALPDLQRPARLRDRAGPRAARGRRAGRAGRGRLGVQRVGPDGRRAAPGPAGRPVRGAGRWRCRVRGGAADGDHGRRALPGPRGRARLAGGRASSPTSRVWRVDGLAGAGHRRSGVHAGLRRAGPGPACWSAGGRWSRAARC